MMIEAHDLHSEFPEHGEAIHALKVSNAHFVRLFDDYHSVNREVLRFEEGVEHASDADVEAAKKRRLQLKDELYAMLRDCTTAQ